VQKQVEKSVLATNAGTVANRPWQRSCLQLKLLIARYIVRIV
jgi:hypothetical protein